MFVVDLWLVEIFISRRRASGGIEVEIRCTKGSTSPYFSLGFIDPFVQAIQTSSAAHAYLRRLRVCTEIMQVPLWHQFQILYDPSAADQFPTQHQYP
jgi:hypothetical protein